MQEEFIAKSNLKKKFDLKDDVLLPCEVYFISDISRCFYAICVVLPLVQFGGSWCRNRIWSVLRDGEALYVGSADGQIWTPG